VLVVAASRGSSALAVRRVTLPNAKVQWSGVSVPASEYDTQLLAAGDSGVLLAGPTVVAFDAGTGRAKWRQSLAAPLARPCTMSCAAIEQGVLAALSADGTVQTFAMADGRPLWSKRLNSTPRYLVGLANAFAADDSYSQSDPGHVLDIFDPASGSLRRLEPVCSSDPSDPHRPSDEQDWLPLADGRSVIVLATGNNGCAQRYALGDFSRMWDTEPTGDNNPIPFTWTGETQASVGGILWTNDGGQPSYSHAYTIDAGTGAIRDLGGQPQFDLVVRGIVAGTAVIEAAPQYASSRPEIWGVDIATGTRRWRQSSRAAVGDTKQQVAVSNNGVVVIWTDGDKRQAHFEALDPRTGATLGTSTMAAGLIPSIDDVSTSGNDVLVRVDGRVVLIDGATAAIKGGFGTAD
jgi:outer membrane protein assembly factor BamB